MMWKTSGPVLRYHPTCCLEELSNIKEMCVKITVLQTENAIHDHLIFKLNY
jgi:hypothetical protein